MRHLNYVTESWPIKGNFRIARGAKTDAYTLMVKLKETGKAGLKTGRAECVPYARYGESIESVSAQIETLRPALERGLSHQNLQDALPAGAARNALDCALWDLEAKLTDTPVWKRAGLASPKPLCTAFTIGVGSPQEMAIKATAAAVFPLLKVKLAGDGNDLARLSAIHAARPDTAFIVDANEGLDLSRLQALLPELQKLNVVLIEQPLPVGEDHALAGFSSPITLCADESLHTCADLGRLAGLYGAVNIKLDKTGGLSEAMRLIKAAKAKNLKVMLGCMVGTSLGMAPSLLLGGQADFIDLDGPLLLEADRNPGLRYEGAMISPPEPLLWG